VRTVRTGIDTDGSERSILVNLDRVVALQLRSFSVATASMSVMGVTIPSLVNILSAKKGTTESHARIYSITGMLASTPAADVGEKCTPRPPKFKSKSKHIQAPYQANRSGQSCQCGGEGDNEHPTKRTVLSFLGIVGDAVCFGEVAVFQSIHRSPPVRPIKPCNHIIAAHACTVGGGRGGWGEREGTEDS
jgi:hypothetical protein